MREFGNILLNALLGLSTLFIALAAFAGLKTWKQEAARRLALSLLQSTLYLEKVAIEASRQGKSVANLCQWSSCYKGLPERIIQALDRLQNAQSTWQANLKAAAISWGGEVTEKANDLQDALDQLTEVLKKLTFHAATLEGFGQEQGEEIPAPNWCDLDKVIRNGSSALSEYLEKHLRL